MTKVTERHRQRAREMVARAKRRSREDWEIDIALLIAEVEATALAQERAEAMERAFQSISFDVEAPDQEALAIKFSNEIAGQKGKLPCPPDPVRLLEMAEELYRAEMRYRLEEASEKREQAISYVYGQLMDSSPERTREDVARAYDERHGTYAEGYTAGLERAAQLAEQHDHDDGRSDDCEGCGEVIAARIRGHSRPR